MPRSTVAQEVPADCTRAFDLIHDYARRLDWDPFLREAVVLDGDGVAGLGVTTRCTARRWLGGLAMVTRYVSWTPGTVAAVKMTQPTPLFDRFAASIRHRSTGDGRSEVRYVYNFRARPRGLRWLLEPLMNWVMRRETRARLVALAAALETPGPDRRGPPRRDSR